MRVNEQVPVPMEKSVPEDGRIAVHEMFYTLQGEGPLSGSPAVFVRLAGCTLRCVMCDTQYDNFHRKTLEDVLYSAELLAPDHCGLCVVTGGEPARQALFPELVNVLLRRFLTVQVETSGSCWQPAFAELKREYRERVVVVCSPKTTKIHPEWLPWVDHYKYVVAERETDALGLLSVDPQTGKPFVVACPQSNRAGTIPPVWLSPWDVQDEEQNLRNRQWATKLCLSRGYRLSLQVHKIVGVP